MPRSNFSLIMFKRRDQPFTNKKRVALESERLHRDIQELEDALILHARFQTEQDASVRGILRKEIGGSYWQYGAEGKLKIYRSKGDGPDRAKGKVPHTGHVGRATFGKKSTENKSWQAGVKLRHGGRSQLDSNECRTHPPSKLKKTRESLQASTLKNKTDSILFGQNGPELSIICVKPSTIETQTDKLNAPKNVQTRWNAPSKNLRNKSSKHFYLIGSRQSHQNNLAVGSPKSHENDIAVIQQSGQTLVASSGPPLLPSHGSSGPPLPSAVLMSPSSTDALSDGNSCSRAVCWLETNSVEGKAERQCLNLFLKESNFNRLEPSLCPSDVAVSPGFVTTTDSAGILSTCSTTIEPPGIHNIPSTTTASSRNHNITLTTSKLRKSMSPFLTLLLSQDAADIEETDLICSPLPCTKAPPHGSDEAPPNTSADLSKQSMKNQSPSVTGQSVKHLIPEADTLVTAAGHRGGRHGDRQRPYSTETTSRSLTCNKEVCLSTGQRLQTAENKPLMHQRVDRWAASVHEQDLTLCLHGSAAWDEGLAPEEVTYLNQDIPPVTVVQEDNSNGQEHNFSVQKYNYSKQEHNYGRWLEAQKRCMAGQESVKHSPNPKTEEMVSPEIKILSLSSLENEEEGDNNQKAQISLIVDKDGKSYQSFNSDESVNTITNCLNYTFDGGFYFSAPCFSDTSSLTHMSECTIPSRLQELGTRMTQTMTAENDEKIFFDESSSLKNFEKIVPNDELCQKFDLPKRPQTKKKSEEAHKILSDFKTCTNPGDISPSRNVNAKLSECVAVQEIPLAYRSYQVALSKIKSKETTQTPAPAHRLLPLRGYLDRLRHLNSSLDKPTTSTGSLQDLTSDPINGHMPGDTPSGHTCKSYPLFSSEISDSVLIDFKKHHLPVRPPRSQRNGSKSFRQLKEETFNLKKNLQPSISDSSCYVPSFPCQAQGRDSTVNIILKAYGQSASQELFSDQAESANERAHHIQDVCAEQLLSSGSKLEDTERNYYQNAVTDCIMNSKTLSYEQTLLNVHKSLVEPQADKTHQQPTNSLVYKRGHLQIKKSNDRNGPGHTKALTDRDGQEQMQNDTDRISQELIQNETDRKRQEQVQNNTDRKSEELVQNETDSNGQQKRIWAETANSDYFHLFLNSLVPKNNLNSGNLSEISRDLPLFSSQNRNVDMPLCHTQTIELSKSEDSMKNLTQAARQTRETDPLNSCSQDHEPDSDSSTSLTDISVDSLLENEPVGKHHKSDSSQTNHRPETSQTFHILNTSPKNSVIVPCMQTRQVSLGPEGDIFSSSVKMNLDSDPGATSFSNYGTRLGLIPVTLDHQGSSYPPVFTESSGTFWSYGQTDQSGMSLSSEQNPLLTYGNQLAKSNICALENEQRNKIFNIQAENPKSQLMMSLEVKLAERTKRHPLSGIRPSCILQAPPQSDQMVLKHNNTQTIQTGVRDNSLERSSKLIPCDRLLPTNRLHLHLKNQTAGELHPPIKKQSWSTSPGKTHFLVDAATLLAQKESLKPVTVPPETPTTLKTELASNSVVDILKKAMSDRRWAMAGTDQSVDVSSATSWSLQD